MHQVGPAVAAYDYEAQNEQELSFKVGDTIEITTYHEDGWCTGVLDGVTGLVSPSFLVFDGAAAAADGAAYDEYQGDAAAYAEAEAEGDVDGSAGGAAAGSLEARKAKRKMMLEQRNQLRAQAESLTNQRKALEEDIKALENSKLELHDTVEKLSHTRIASDYVLDLVKLSMLLDELTHAQQQYQGTSRELENELKALRTILVKEVKQIISLEEPKNELATSSVELMQCYAEHEGKIISWWTNKLEFHQKLEQLRASLAQAIAS